MRLYLIFILSLFIYSSLYSQDALFQPYNLDIEIANEELMPGGWQIPNKVEKLGYNAFATKFNPYKGNYSLQLIFEGDSVIDDMYGSVFQTIDASPYIGKTIRIEAAIRAQLFGEGSAHLWVHERMKNNQTSFINTMDDSPVVVNEWQKQSLEYTVTEFANTISFGLLLWGRGVAWIDDVSISISGKEANAPPKELSDINLSNLTTLANAVSAIKFYSPSKEAFNCDWDNFLHYTIKNLIDIKDNIEFLDSLKTHLSALAPGIILKKIEEKSNYDRFPKPKNAVENIVLAYMTKGIFNNKDASFLGTDVINIYSGQRLREAVTFQIVDAIELREREIEIQAKANVIPRDLAAAASIALRIDFEDSQEPENIFMDSNPVKDFNNRILKIKTKIPKNAKHLRVGLIFDGEGEAYFDDIKIIVKQADMEATVYLENGKFDRSDKLNSIPKWQIPSSSINAGYFFEIDEIKKALKIYTNENELPTMPKPGEIASIKINNEHEILFPIAVYTDGSNTLPIANIINYPQTVMSHKDLYSRLTVVIDLWSYLKEFYPLDYSEKQWETILHNSLKEVSIINNKESFDIALNKLLSITNNSLSRLWHTSDNYGYSLPLIWEWDGNKLIVTEVDSSETEIQIGDIITKIDDNDTKDLIREISSTIPGATESWKSLKAINYLRLGKLNESLKINTDKNIEKVLYKNIPSNLLVYERPPTLYELDSGIVYIDATRISDVELKKQLDNLKESKGLIVDFRGLSLLSEHFLSFFTTEPIQTVNWELPLITNPNKPPFIKNVEGYVNSNEVQLTPNTVFLCSDRSLGYSELILAIAKKYDLVEIIGEATAGSIGEIALVRLPAQYNVALSILRGKFFDGENVSNYTVTPNKSVKKDNNYKNDPSLQKALDYVKSNL